MSCWSQWLEINGNGPALLLSKLNWDRTNIPSHDDTFFDQMKGAAWVLIEIKTRKLLVAKLCQDSGVKWDEQSPYLSVCMCVTKLRSQTNLTTIS